MKRFLRFWVVTLVAIAAVITIGGWAGGCGTTLHKSAVAADSIASSLKTAADINQTLYTSSQISLEERQQVAALIYQAAEANQAFVVQLTLAEKNGGQVNQANVLSAFNTFLIQLKSLEQDGVLHLKSPQAQTAFSAVLASIQASVAILEVELGATGTSRNQAAPLGLLSLSLLVLTPTEIGELITLATSVIGEGAALVKKLIAMKGEADAKLMADAAAENSEAMTEAKAEEGAS